MLLEFKCRNFLSFKNEASLNLSSIDSYEEHSETHIVKNSDTEINLLKSIAIFGSNGGGKSNFTRAITFMDTFIHNSFRDSLSKGEERGVWDGFFKLCPDSTKEPSMFEVSFFVGNILYRYGFEIFDWKISSEWLYKTEKRETLLFIRKFETFKINHKSFPEGKRYKEVNSNVLFLSFLAQYNSDESGKVYSFFRNLNVIDALDESHIRHVTKLLLKKDELFNKWLSMALKFLEINSVHLDSEEELLTRHSVYDGNNLLAGYIDFSVEHDESEGTKKLIYLLGAIYHTLKDSGVFFIDEFNSKLHPNLCLKIIRLFHEFNFTNAQFIITALDPTFLDKDVFRRDQIWFVDRNQFGASELYPMSNFKASDGLRNMSDFRKKYLNSEFGAAESISFTEDFIKLTKKIHGGI